MPTVGLPGDALDQDRFGLQAEAQILGERGDAAVLDAGFRLELERGDDRAGIDLDHRAGTLNSSNLLLIRAAMSFSSWLSYGFLAAGSLSSVSGGSCQ